MLEKVVLAVPQAQLPLLLLDAVAVAVAVELLVLELVELVVPVAPATIERCDTTPCFKTCTISSCFSFNLFLTTSTYLQYELEFRIVFMGPHNRVNVA